MRAAVKVFPTALAERAIVTGLSLTDSKILIVSSVYVSPNIDVQKPTGSSAYTSSCLACLDSEMRRLDSVQASASAFSIQAGLTVCFVCTAYKLLHHLLEYVRGVHAFLFG